jgi:hypothetical protein
MRVTLYPSASLQSHAPCYRGAYGGRWKPGTVTKPGRRNLEAVYQKGSRPARRAVSCTPGNKVCAGVWARQVKRHALCMEAL